MSLYNLLNKETLIYVVSLVAQTVKNLPVDVGDMDLIPGWGRSLGEGNSNPFQYSYLENSMDRGAWQPPVHGFTELDTTERLTT